jgi:hypothetical protein
MFRRPPPATRTSFRRSPLPVPSVIGKYRRAVINDCESRQYFDDLSSVVEENLRNEWEEAIHAAEAVRITNPEKMDIMGNTFKEGQYDTPLYDLVLISHR